MTELKIEKSTAKRIYNESPESVKVILVETFGENLFKKRNFTDITSYEIACEERPVDDEDKIHPWDAPYIVALKELNHITKVVNGDWVPDFENHNQKKWEQVFTSSGSGFAFSLSSSTYDCRLTGAGSRLCCETEEKSDFIGRTFLSKFKLLITNKK